MRHIRKVYPNTESQKKPKDAEHSQNLEVTEEGVLAVQDFNLEIADKEFIVLVGPSGCGKSTTLRMVAGLEDITSGDLLIDGQRMNDVEPKDRNIAMVFQNYALYPHMTVYENMAFSLKLKKLSAEEIDQKVRQAAEILEIPIEERGAMEIARRSRGTPRVANRLLKRVRDFAQIEGDGIVTDVLADKALEMLEVDKAGLDHTDRRMLDAMIRKFAGGPVGLDTLAASISEETDTIEDVYEPYLLQLGFINRTPRGRVVTRAGYAHMNIPYPMD